MNLVANSNASPDKLNSYASQHSKRNQQIVVETFKSSEHSVEFTEEGKEQNEGSELHCLSPLSAKRKCKKKKKKRKKLDPKNRRFSTIEIMNFL